MSDQRRIEHAHAEREAMHAVLDRSPGSGAAVRAALERYVASERYREEPKAPEAVPRHSDDCLMTPPTQVKGTGA